jgi:hypothetical protein
MLSGSSIGLSRVLRQLLHCWTSSLDCFLHAKNFMPELVFHDDVPQFSIWTNVCLIWTANDALLIGASRKSLTTRESADYFR